MSDSTLRVEAGQSTLEALVRTPTRGLCELIWNAFDEDAHEVRIAMERNELQGLSAVVVSDDGNGMNRERAEMAFRRLGDSWKQSKPTTDGGRSVHGKKGQGRFTAFAVGNRLTWISTAESVEGDLRGIKITGDRSSLGRVSIADCDAGSESGTTVRIENCADATESMMENLDDIRGSILAEFALHLQRYEDFSIDVAGQTLRPESVIDRTIEESVDLPEGVTGAANLTVIIWKLDNVQRRMYLCGESGQVLADLEPRVQAPGVNFTAYVSWSGFTPGDVEVELIRDDEESDFGQVLEASREKLREVLSGVSRATEAERLRVWKSEGILPFEGEPESEVEKTQRQAFNLVAMAASRPIDEIKSSKTKAMVLALLKESLESGPDAVLPLMKEVLRLPQPRVEELQALLTRTSLSKIITAAHGVGARIDFLEGLKEILFDRQIKQRLLERRQLHRILAQETWVFGEEWSLTGDDERLLKVLRKYLKKLDADASLAESKDDIRSEDGKLLIPDLIMGRVLETAKDEWEFLVVELKRPSHKIKEDDVAQLKSYAFAILDDDVFNQPNVRWHFWLVGNETSGSVDRSRKQRNTPFGVVHDDESATITVKTWAEVISAAEHRMKFVQQSLEYESSAAQGIDALRAKHAEYLPEDVVVE